MQLLALDKEVSNKKLRKYFERDQYRKHLFTLTYSIFKNHSLECLLLHIFKRLVIRAINKIQSLVTLYRRARPFNSEHPYP